MKYALIFIPLFTLSLISVGQDYPIYNQYFNNPFLINAGYVGSSRYTDISVIQRRQWVGIEDAPVFTTLTLQYPTRKGISLGLGISSQSSVMLRRTSALVTFGYEALLGEAHSIRFGLSGGLGNYHLDINKINDQSLNDQAIGKYMASRYFFDGQFGIVYSLKKFHLGFALPRMLDTKTFTQSQNNDVNFTELKFSLISASYVFGNGKEGISFEPYIIYRMGNKIKEQWEGLGTIYYKNLLWIGGSYRQQHGPTAFLGFAVKTFKFGYSYEIPTSTIAQHSKGSHEIQLNLILGKNRGKSSSEKSLAKLDPPSSPDTPDNEKSTVQSQNPAGGKAILKKEENKVVETETKLVEDKVVPVETNRKPDVTNELPSSEVKTIEKSLLVKSAASKGEIKVEAKVSSNPLELKKGNYVVVAVFKNAQNAANYRKKLKVNGYSSSIGFSSKTNSLYVYLSSHPDILDARNELGIRKVDMFRNAWILKVE